MVQISSAPPLWWDEGWTLSVARNWVELGHYGRLLNGDLAPPGLNAAFPVTASIAFAFRLLGVGIWQARLVSVVFTLGTLMLLSYLASRLYDRTIAIATLAALLFMSANLYLHPALVGRQVLAEPMMLFFLISGYACFLLTCNRSRWILPLAIVFWGVGLKSKAQPLPFWIVSLTVPLLLALYQRRWKLTLQLSISLLGSLFTSQTLLEGLKQFLLQGQPIDRAAVSGLYGVTAFVPVFHIRLLAFFAGVTIGLPTLLGLGYATWRLFENRRLLELDGGRQVVRLMLLTFAGSWFAWYLLLSVGWGRYLYPATFVGSIFVAVLLRDLTDRFNWTATVKRSAHLFKDINRQNAGALLAILLVVGMVPATLKVLYRSYVVEANNSVRQTADFLNSHIPPCALIETYDSELFFFLKRPYHYPPDELHVELNRRTFLAQKASIDYNPLSTHPDYLVIGPYSRKWHLYAPLVTSNRFVLLRDFGLYQIYERRRNATLSTGMTGHIKTENVGQTSE